MSTSPGGWLLVPAQWLAVALYLIPVVVTQLARARRDRAPWEIALDIPAAVAVDLLVVLVLAKVVRLEVAAFASRPLWAAAGVWWMRRRARDAGDGPRWPEALNRGAVLAVALPMLLAFGLSYALSRPYVIWDREFHIPVDAALRGQGLPFVSAFEPGRIFHYHFTGDVLASMFQVFSAAVLHSSLALSLAHDVVFTLIAATFALLMMSFGMGAARWTLLGVAAVLLGGPCLLRFGVGEAYLGYSYYALYCWAYRPQFHIAMLMFVGVGGVLVVRGFLLRGLDDGWKAIGPLLACMAVLPITDESSAGVLGLALGAAWLVEPRLLGPDRKRSAALLGVMAVAFIGFNLLFDATLAPGNPVSKMMLVAPRAPGVQQPPIPLTKWNAWLSLIADTLPIWTVLPGLAVVSLRGPVGDRRGRAFLAFVVTLFVVSLCGLTMVEINSPPESHRFLTAAIFTTPLVALLLMRRLATGSVPQLLALAGFGLGVFSTLLWASHYANGHATPEKWFRQRAPYHLHETNCRETANARLGDRPRPVYIETSVFYSYVGCRPSFVAGQTADKWAVRLRPTMGLAGLAMIDREMVPAGQPLDAICPAGRTGDLDPVCTYAVTHGACTPEGAAFVRCPLGEADRRALLGPRRP
jgi:hypothetical protein